MLDDKDYNLSSDPFDGAAIAQCPTRSSVCQGQSALAEVQSLGAIISRPDGSALEMAPR
jgi:hypothetical protein